ncbi:hypothetical protein [Arthrobacter sp. ISL-65]|uniref:hypothetical protein n=1 Tax=Arthrobacter sp. ISL-65 TaxID=2819112 RepID=UPI001BE74C11|nr:hypothetical protein [Arthrobacter sp. ISL-65]MBT2549985.1 hypothetical protein [Arthrobacter sp. ISL-65]
MSALSVNQSVASYRRASVLEAVAVRIGAGLVGWAERRRVVPEEAVRQQRDAARRRDEFPVAWGCPRRSPLGPAASPPLGSAGLVVAGPRSPGVDIVPVLTQS